MTPQGTVEKIKGYASNGLRYLASAYVRMGSPKSPGRSDDWRREDWTANLVLNEMTTLAHVIALTEGATDDREAMKWRDEIVAQYLERASHDPWLPDER